jgi:hypothetical protein
LEAGRLFLFDIPFLFLYKRKQEAKEKNMGSGSPGSKKRAGFAGSEIQRSSENYAAWGKNIKKLALASILLFAIAALSQSQTITVTSPNGGENWALGSTQNISWRSSGLTGNVTILLFSGGDRVGVIQDKVPVTAGSFSWVVGSYPGGAAVPGTNYKVRIRKPQTEILDVSDRPFTISAAPGAAASISVTSPNGGETWSTNAVHEVRWTSSGISGSVTIKLKKGGAVVKSWTAENTGSSYGSYSWAQTGTDYKIRVENSSGSVFDESDRNFTIQVPAGPTPPPPARSIQAELAQKVPAKVTLRIPPTITSFSLNNGAEAVDGLSVIFNYVNTGNPPTHYRYRVNSGWTNWELVFPGRFPGGNLLNGACEQTVYFQLKNEFGESNVVSDSIKTSNYKTERTISIGEALSYAEPQGFTHGVVWADCNKCTQIMTDSQGAILFLVDSLENPLFKYAQKMTADFELFGGGKRLKPGWEFVSFGMPEITQVGDRNAIDAQGVDFVWQAYAGSRNIRLVVRLWRNMLSGFVTYHVDTITLKGPCTEDVSEAFKQQ